MKIEYKEIINANTIRITTSDERWYKHPKTGEWLPSSTWIAEYAPKGIGFYKWLASKGWDEAESIKVAAGDKGSRVHNATEQLARGFEIKHNDAFPDSNGEIKEITAEDYDAIVSFYDWCNDYNVEFLAHERTVFNGQYKYGGTLDHLVKIDGLIYVLDKKTSSNIYLSHEIQVSSYFHADDVVADKLAILQLGYGRNKKGYKFTEIDDKFDLFLSAYKFWEEDNKNAKPHQKDYPLSLKLKTEDQLQFKIEEE